MRSRRTGGGIFVPGRSLELRANLLRPGGWEDPLEPSDTYSRVRGASEQDGVGEVLGGMQLTKRKPHSERAMMEERMRPKRGERPVRGASGQRAGGLSWWQ